MLDLAQTKKACKQRKRSMARDCGIMMSRSDGGVPPMTWLILFHHLQLVQSRAPECNLHVTPAV